MMYVKEHPYLAQGHPYLVQVHPYLVDSILLLGNDFPFVFIAFIASCWFYFRIHSVQHQIVSGLCVSSMIY